jgi:hypothetical protein
VIGYLAQALLILELFLYFRHFAFCQPLRYENFSAFGASRHFMRNRVAQVEKDRFLQNQIFFAFGAFPDSLFSIHGGYSLLKRIRW